MMTTAQADDWSANRFCSLLNWDQNTRGNWTRRFKGKLLTVYQQSGWWGWSINAGPGKVEFSQRQFTSEGKAMVDLEQALIRHNAAARVRGQ